MDSPLRYSTTFLATPPVSRKSCGLKESLEGFFLGFCFMIGLLDVLPYGHSDARSRLSKTLPQNCAKQDTTHSWATLRPQPGWIAAGKLGYTSLPKERVVFNPEEKSYELRSDPNCSQILAVRRSSTSFFGLLSFSPRAIHRSPGH